MKINDIHYVIPLSLPYSAMPLQNYASNKEVRGGYYVTDGAIHLVAMLNHA